MIDICAQVVTAVHTSTYTERHNLKALTDLALLRPGGFPCMPGVLGCRASLGQPHCPLLQT